MFHLIMVLKKLRGIMLFRRCSGILMKKIDYEIKNRKLKKMVEKKAKELNMSVDDLIWGYVNRGLMSDNISDEVFWDNHTRLIKEVNEKLGLEEYQS